MKSISQIQKPCLALRKNSRDHHPFSVISSHILKRKKGENLIHFQKRSSYLHFTKAVKRISKRKKTLPWTVPQPSRVYLIIFLSWTNTLARSRPTKKKPNSPCYLHFKIFWSKTQKHQNPALPKATWRSKLCLFPVMWNTTRSKTNRTSLMLNKTIFWQDCKMLFKTAQSHKTAFFFMMIFCQEQILGAATQAISHQIANRTWSILSKFTLLFAFNFSVQKH